MTVVDALEPLIASGDLEGVVDLLDRLDGLDGHEADARRAEAARLASTGRLWERVRSERTWVRADREPWSGWSREALDEAWARDRAWQIDLAWSEVLVVLRLLPPSVAARRLRARRVFASASPYGDAERWAAGEARCVEAALGRGTEWGRRFVDALADHTAGRYPDELVGLVDRVLDEWDLPCPTGPDFVRSWLWRLDEHHGEAELTRALRADRHTPRILPVVITAAEGRLTDDFAAAVAAVVRDGLVDRAAVVTRLLEALDPPRSPGVQRWLRALVDDLSLRCDEVPGGLPFVLGVLATSTPGLATALLPIAVDLVADGEELVDLTSTVLSRPGEGLRLSLLSRLTAAGLRDRLGVAAVLAALADLGRTDDLLLADRVARAMAALSHGKGEGAAGRGDVHLPHDGADGVSSEPLGLWDLDVRATWPRHPDGWLDGADWTLHTMVVDLFSRSGTAVRARGSRVDALALTLVHRAPAPGLVLSLLRRLLVTDELSVPAVTRGMEQLFLAGVMRHLWRDALQLAGLACARSPRDAGLHGYLRMLAGYAVEAPDRPLPEGVAMLAEAPGRTKAHLEARRLRDALRGVDTQTESDQATSGPVEGDGWWLRPPRLWAGCPTVPVDVGDRVAKRASTEDLTAWVVRIASFKRRESRYGGRPAAGPGRIVEPSLHLASLVEAAHDHGVDALRDALADHPSAMDRALVSAWAVLQLWQRGGLTPEVHWALAERSHRTEEWQRLVQEDPQGAERLGVTVQEGSRLSPVDWLEQRWPRLDGSAGRRVTALLWSESLLRMGAVRSLLSTPVHLDGTLDLETLLHRLDDARGTHVGAIDLAVALHRLRPLQPGQTRPDRPDPVPIDDRTLVPPGSTVVRLDAIDVLWEQLETGRADWTWVRALSGHHEARSATALVDDIRMSPLDLEVVGQLPGRRWASRSFLRVLPYTRAPLGPDLLTVVLEELCSVEPKRRNTALGDLRALVAQDRLRPGPTLEALHRLREAETEARLQQGWYRPVLERFAVVLEGLFAQGHLRELWPVAVAVVDGFSLSDPHGPGLDDVRDVLARYAAEVPDLVPAAEEEVCCA